MDEKKKAVAESERHQERADKADAELGRVTQRPIMDVFSRLAPNERFSEYLRQEFGRYFKIVNDAGVLTVQDLEDNPVNLGDEPCRFDVNNVRRLVADRQLETVSGLMSAPRNTGGGAPGGSRSGPGPSKKPESTDNASPFGLR